MIRRPPRSTLSSSSAASDVYKRQYAFLASREPAKRGRVRRDECHQIQDLRRPATVGSRRRAASGDSPTRRCTRVGRRPDRGGAIPTRAADRKAPQRRILDDGRAPQRRRLGHAFLAGVARFLIAAIYTSDAADEEDSVDLGG